MIKKVKKTLPKMYGNNLKSVMKEKGIIVQELADRTGIGRSYLSDFINNKRQNMSLAFAFDISLVLEEPIERLFIRHKPIEYIQY
jgi:transcriptional regulator with XRE-family HTH domain